MVTNAEVKNITIVGTGVIGASWAAYYLSRGFNVIATDPAPNAEANLRKYVDEAWTTLSKNGMYSGASRDRLTFEPKMALALANATLSRKMLRSGKTSRSNCSLRWTMLRLRDPSLPPVLQASRWTLFSRSASAPNVVSSDTRSIRHM